MHCTILEENRSSLFSCAEEDKGLHSTDSPRTIMEIYSVSTDTMKPIPDNLTSHLSLDGKHEVQSPIETVMSENCSSTLHSPMKTNEIKQATIKHAPLRTKYLFNGTSCSPDFNKPLNQPPVRRQLFKDSEADDVPSGGKDDKLLRIPEEDKMVKMYGMVIPDRFHPDHCSSKNGPKLIKRKPGSDDDDFPYLTQRSIADYAKANHLIIKQWMNQAEAAKLSGKGKEKTCYQAIQTQPQDKTFEEVTSNIVQSLPPAKRYPLQRYIKILKTKEEKAVRTARIFRNKSENAEYKLQVVKAAAASKERSIRAFWRNNVSEQCTRGGRMLNLSLNSKQKHIT